MTHPPRSTPTSEDTQQLRTGVVLQRLDAARQAACRAAERAGWRWDRDGRHPSFAAVRDEVLVILSEIGIEPTRCQLRMLDWLSGDELETVVDVVELILAGRAGGAQ